MLKVKLNPQFETLVKIRNDAMSGDLTCTFGAYKLSEMDALSAAAVKQAVESGERQSTIVLRQVLKGWKTFELNDEPFAFAPEKISELCDLPGVEPALLNAFYRGHSEATAKN